MQTAAARRGIGLLTRRSSSPTFRTVLTDISKSILGSNIRWRGKSFAASVPSGSVIPQKGQKRLSKQERRALVESFVDKYRASNGGSFPCVSYVLKEAGGSYYTVRLIVQELEYNHKVSPSSKINQSGKVEEIICPSSGVKEEASICEAEGILSPTGEVILHGLGDPSISDSQGNTEVHKSDVVSNISEERLQNNDLDSSAGHKSKASVVQADISMPLYSEVTVETPSSPTGIKEGEQKNAVEFLQNASDLRVDLTESQEALRQKELNSDQGGSSTKTTGVWGNLKSLADGIISFWKKM